MMNRECVCLRGFTVLHHIFDIQILYANYIVIVHVVARKLMQEVYMIIQFLV